MSYCPICHNQYTSPEQVKEEEIRFTDNGIILTATARRRDDAFFVITKGQYKGNLVHIWDIIKK